MSIEVSTPILRIASGPLAGKVFEIRSTLRLGRHPFNEVSLADPGVSRYHCWILLREGAPYLEDLASANGTYLNGIRVQKRQALKPGDLVKTGSTEFRVAEEEAA
jgi:pSer/pThr/pTyr-binding forkhead associated (FHA) protein